MRVDEERIPLLVLGLGNVLCSDDGAGVAAVARLRRTYWLGTGVHVADGGTLGMGLLPLLSRADRALLVDALRADEPAGTLVELEGSAVTDAVRERLSVHQVGVADVLDGARWQGRAPHTLRLLGVVPETLTLGVGLSPAVARVLPALCERAAANIRALGFDARLRRSSDACDDDDPALALARVLGM